MFTFITYNTRTNTGFSLVEVLVAISILLIALVGPMNSITRSSQSTEVANQQVPAVFLAQEGVELVHKVRDDELLTWFANDTHDFWQETKDELDDCFDTDGCGLTIDENDTVSVVSCGNIDNCRVHYDENANRARYTQGLSGPPATPYTRVVRLNEVRADAEIEIVSTVTWRTGSLISEQRAEVQTSIFKIYGTD